jgi:hypothetical protein
VGNNDALVAGTIYSLMTWSSEPHLMEMECIHVWAGTVLPVQGDFYIFGRLKVSLFKSYVVSPKKYSDYTAETVQQFVLLTSYNCMQRAPLPY